MTHAIDVRVIATNQADSGAYPASPSFSQYPHAWLRDGSFIAYAMDRAGEHASSARFHAWVASTVVRYEDVIDDLVEGVSRGVSFDETAYLPARFGVDGSWRRDGWPAFQLDGYGQWLWSLGEHVRRVGTGAVSSDLASAADLVARYLAAFWDEPCYDAWEEHRSQLHTATLASTAAGLRAHRHVRGPAAAGAPLDAALASVLTMVHEECVVDGRFVKFVEHPVVDASLLWLSTPFGIVEDDDPRMHATVDEIEATLVVDGGVTRYAADTFYGGGAWVLLTAWLGWYHARQGRFDRARSYAAWIERQRDVDGMLPEQVPTSRTNARFLRHWTSRWGPSAKPLLWSHAMTIVLRSELEDARPASALEHPR